MTVRSIWVNNTFIDVTGIGYIPDGNFEINHLKIDPIVIPELLMTLKIGTLCNSAELHQTHNHLKSGNIQEILPKAHFLRWLGRQIYLKGI